MKFLADLETKTRKRIMYVYCNRYFDNDYFCQESMTNSLDEVVSTQWRMLMSFWHSTLFIRHCSPFSKSTISNFIEVEFNAVLARSWKISS